MGSFETEIDILLHGIIRGYLSYCCLFGPENDNKYLEAYTNNLVQSSVEEQVQYFNNVKE